MILPGQSVADANDLIPVRPGRYLILDVGLSATVDGPIVTVIGTDDSVERAKERASAVVPSVVRVGEWQECDDGWHAPVSHDEELRIIDLNTGKPLTRQHITIVDATPEETEAAEEALRDLAQQQEADEIPSTVAEKDRDTVRILRQIRAELAAAAERPSERTTPSPREWRLEGVVADAFRIINRHLTDLGST